jgi:hypothetical protein
MRPAHSRAFLNLLSHQKTKKSIQSKIFLHYLTSTANDGAREAKRQTVLPADVLAALGDTGFDELVEAAGEAVAAASAKAAGQQQQRRASATPEPDAVAAAGDDDGPPAQKRRLTSEEGEEAAA